MTLSISVFVAVLGGLGGLALAGWALCFDRSLGVPRCPKCWYLMVGAAGMRCPECGHVAEDIKEFFRTRRRWRWAGLGMLIALGTPGYVLATSFWDELLLAILPRWAAVGEQHLGLFTVGLYADHRDNRPMQARITRDGEPQFTLSAWDVSIGAQAMDGTQTVGVGEDITGEGVRNLILREWTGGTHCCWTYYVLSLDPEEGARVVATIRAGHSEAAFEDIDGDGRPECIVQDWTFHWWNDSAAAYAPKVILCYRGGQYVVAEQLMARQGPSEAELMHHAAEVRTGPSATVWNAGSVPEEYWIEMLELIYVGHEDSAWRFAEEAWPSACPGKDEFLASFRRQLGESPYWPAVRAVGLP